MQLFSKILIFLFNNKTRFYNPYLSAKRLTFFRVNEECLGVEVKALIIVDSGGKDSLVTILSVPKCP